MGSAVLLSCRSLGIVCSHRQRTNSGLSASSSSSYTSSNPSRGHFDCLDMLVGRLARVCTIDSLEDGFHRKWNVLKLDSESALLRTSCCSRSFHSKTGEVRAKVHDCAHCVEFEINTSTIQTGNIWDQCIRLVQTEETTEEKACSLAARVMSRSGHAGFAAISARTHRPPPLPKAPERSKLRKYVTAGVLLSTAALIIWQVNRTESYAREQLISRDQPSAPLPPQQMASAFARAKASVAQTACVNRAVAAVRNNNFMECTIEMELALEENRLARTSIESDFYEEEEIFQVYQGVIKMWLDGYPLDYGRVLQLRNLLDLPSPKAEALEQEVLQQSDTYVI